MSLRLPSVIPKGDEVAFRDDRGEDTSSEEALRFWHQANRPNAVTASDAAKLLMRDIRYVLSETALEVIPKGTDLSRELSG